MNVAEGVSFHENVPWKFLGLQVELFMAGHQSWIAWGVIKPAGVRTASFCIKTPRLLCLPSQSGCGFPALMWN